MAKKKSLTKQPRKPAVAYTRDIGTEICLRMADGESLRQICSNDGMPTMEAVVRWALNPESEAALDGFTERYQWAMITRGQLLADEAIEIADDDSQDYKTVRDKKGNPKKVIDHENIQRSKLRVDTRKWFAAKLAPKLYGDKTTVDHTGTVGLQRLHDSDLDARYEQLQRELNVIEHGSAD